MAVTINADTTNGLVMTPDTSGEIKLQSAGTDTVTVDTSGNVGIGTSSPSGKAEVNGGNFVIDHTTPQIIYKTSGTETGYSRVSSNYLEHNGTSGVILKSNGTTRMSVGATTWFNGTSSSQGAIQTQKGGAAGGSILIFHKPNSGSTNVILNYYGATYVGGMNMSNTGTQFLTSSDYRLKENNVNINDGISRVKLLKPYRFNFIAEPDETVDGFFAHEVQSVVPEAISGTHNEVDDDGNPVYQGIDQAKLVPLLTAALQEAITKIEDLETRIQALENA